MRTTSSTLCLALLCLAVACDDDDASDDAASTAGDATDASASASDPGSSDGGAGESSSGSAAATGSVTLNFSVSNGVRMGPTLEDPLVGTIYGDLFLTSDVTITGPAEGAVSVASVTLENVDLTTVDPSTLTWTSDALPPESYTFLGMFDVDGNFAETDHNPDAGDPVTLPNQKFDVVADTDTPFTVMFELVYG